MVKFGNKIEINIMDKNWVSTSRPWKQPQKNTAGMH